MTKKYFAFREIVKKYKDVQDVEFTTKIERRAYGEVRWSKCAGLVLSWNFLWKTLDV